MKKPKERKGKIIFINAVNEVRIERTNAWLEPQHIKKISTAYWQLKDVDGFAKVMSKEAVLENNGNLSVQLYVKQAQNDSEHDVEELVAEVKKGQENINSSLENLLNRLKDFGIDA
jgi:type I restriction enzyme M protein